MRKLTLRDVAFAAILAAVYAVLTLSLPIPQYGQVQLRVAEALTVLPFFYPAAVQGLFIGCIVANLGSHMMMDMVFGSLATLLAGIWTARLKNRWLAPLPPVICNAVIVGAELMFYETDLTAATAPRAFLLNAAGVGAGEFLACYLLGTLLLTAVYRNKFCHDRIDPKRLAEIRGFR